MKGTGDGVPSGDSGGWAALGVAFGAVTTLIGKLVGDRRRAKAAAVEAPTNNALAALEVLRAGGDTWKALYTEARDEIREVRLRCNELERKLDAAEAACAREKAQLVAEYEARLAAVRKGP
jgi:hypothetical protein